MQDRKKSAGSSYRPKKRGFYGNQNTSDSNIQSTSAAAKKLKEADPELDVTVHPSHAYMIIHWALFLTLQNKILCKDCGKDLEFGKSDQKGLGFQLDVICDCEKKLSIPSSPRIGRGYEINRRIVYVMRIVGLGFYGLLNFCGLMDISVSAFSSSGFYKCVDHIHIASKAVTEIVFKKAAKEEQEKNKEKGLPEDKLSVSGDGSWPKRGFTALLGLVSLIGKYTNKVIDVIVKSKICQACSKFAKKHPEDTPEFDAWFTEHCENNACERDHDGSAGLIEVEGVQDMFLRSKEQYGVMYEFYIGDGDSKTFKQLEELKPYGDELQVKKKACVLHVGKTIYRRGKNAKKNLAKVKKALRDQEKKKELLQSAEGKKRSPEKTLIKEEIRATGNKNGKIN